MQPDDEIRLRHMLDATKAALKFADCRQQQELESDLQLQFAIVRAIEIIGEAAARISPEMRSLHPDIPWSSIVSMRNRLVHAYFDVDHDILWNTVVEALPVLERQIETLLKSPGTR
jgi:uncharacterized protein with HEPN domain